MDTGIYGLDYCDLDQPGCSEHSVPGHFDSSGLLLRTKYHGLGAVAQPRAPAKDLDLDVLHLRFGTYPGFSPRHGSSRRPGYGDFHRGNHPTPNVFRGSQFLGRSLDV